MLNGGRDYMGRRINIMTLNLHWICGFDRASIWREWSEWIFIRCSDITNICFSWTLLKWRVCLGNGWHGHTMIPLMGACESSICMEIGSFFFVMPLMRPDVTGIWDMDLGYNLSIFSEKHIISIESNNCPSPAIPCQIARLYGDWLLVLRLLGICYDFRRFERHHAEKQHYNDFR